MECPQKITFHESGSCIYMEVHVDDQYMDMWLSEEKSIEVKFLLCLWCCHFKPLQRFILEILTKIINTTVDWVQFDQLVAGWAFVRSVRFLIFCTIYRHKEEHISIFRYKTNIDIAGLPVSICPIYYMFTGVITGVKHNHREVTVISWKTAMFTSMPI
jgi:hypothetical protein